MTYDYYKVEQISSPPCLLLFWVLVYVDACYHRKKNTIKKDFLWLICCHVMCKRWKLLEKLCYVFQSRGWAKYFNFFFFYIYLIFIIFLHQLWKLVYWTVPLSASEKKYVWLIYKAISDTLPFKIYLFLKNGENPIFRVYENPVIESVS